MGRAVSVPQRHLIFQRRPQGHRTEAIAADLDVPIETGRTLFRRHGAAAITPGYAHGGSHQTSQADPDLIALATQSGRVRRVRDDAPCLPDEDAPRFQDASRGRGCDVEDATHPTWLARNSRTSRV